MNPCLAYNFQHESAELAVMENDEQLPIHYFKRVLVLDLKLCPFDSFFRFKILFHIYFSVKTFVATL